MKNFNFLENTTAIIVLYGENEKILGRNLDNLKNIKKIIIDNGGDKKLKKKIISKYNVEKYILNEKNIGYSAACNQGLRLSDSKFSLVINPDCIITEKNLKILCEKIDQYKDALIVSPTSYDSNNNLSFNGGPLVENQKISKILDLKGDTCVQRVLGACMLLRTSDIKTKNLYFDENFFLYFSDDDLCRRIFSFKKSIIQIYDASCIHEHGKSKVKNRFKRIYLREYNFTYDQLYYLFKVKKHNQLFNKLSKKIFNYFLKFIINCFLLRFEKCVYYYSRILAYNKFKKKFVN